MTPKELSAEELEAIREKYNVPEGMAHLQMPSEYDHVNALLAHILVIEADHYTWRRLERSMRDSRINVVRLELDAALTRVSKLEKAREGMCHHAGDCNVIRQAREWEAKKRDKAVQQRNELAEQFLLMIRTRTWSSAMEVAARNYLKETS